MPFCQISESQHNLPISLSSTSQSTLGASSSLILLTIQPKTRPKATLAMESLASEWTDKTHRDQYEGCQTHQWLRSETVSHLQPAAGCGVAGWPLLASLMWCRSNSSVNLLPGRQTDPGYRNTHTHYCFATCSTCFCQEECTSPRAARNNQSKLEIVIWLRLN